MIGQGKEQVISSTEEHNTPNTANQEVPGGEPMSLPDTSDPGSFLFRIGTIFSSKYSIAMEEISLNS